MQCPHCNARIAADAGRSATCGRNLVAGATAGLEQTLYQEDETRLGPELDQTFYQDDDPSLVSGLEQTRYHAGETGIEVQREAPREGSIPAERPSGSLGVTRVSFDGEEGGGPPRGAALGEMQRFKPGTLLLDRYRIVARLGRGGMGEVYRADDVILEQPVALKFLVQGAEALGPRLEQLRAEVRVARQISHPNICAVCDIGEAQKTPLISMELIDGEDLQTLLESAG